MTLTAKSKNNDSEINLLHIYLISEGTNRGAEAKLNFKPQRFIQKLQTYCELNTQKLLKTFFSAVSCADMSRVSCLFEGENGCYHRLAACFGPDPEVVHVVVVQAWLGSVQPKVPAEKPQKRTGQSC